MTILLASLIARLSADVPPQAGVPSANQYAQAVKDAVADLSRRASVPRVVTVSVLAGTAAYVLPADFQQIIRLSQIGAAFTGGVFVTGQGLIPVGDGYKEQVMVAGNQLTIYPTPSYAADRQLVYAAGDALNVVVDGYDTLTEDRATIALLHASAACLERIATSPRGDAIMLVTGQDTAGQDRLDTTKRAESLRATAVSYREQYLAAIRQLNAALGGLG